MLAGLDADIQRTLDGALAPELLTAFGLAVLMPLLGLIAGTGAIGPEIDEGSIVYLLAKPLNRYSIVLTKLVVAIGVVVAFGVLPVAVAGVVLTGEVGAVTVAFTVGALAAGVAYCAVFLLLAVVTRNAVVIGLIYALIWESLVGGFVPGAQALSIQQWSLAVVQEAARRRRRAPRPGRGRRLRHGAGAAVVVTVAATAYAGSRLQTLRLNDET